ncbi:hypothetical protein CEQ30_34535 [Nocardia brasiliensis]|nr:hypothetical protein CEQ30_34535 [Nocardia brasiliensis]
MLAVSAGGLQAISRGVSIRKITAGPIRSGGIIELVGRLPLDCKVRRYESGSVVAERGIPTPERWGEPMGAHSSRKARLPSAPATSFPHTVDTLASLRFSDLLEVPEHETMALVQCLSDPAAAPANSRRRPVPGVDTRG